MRLPNKVTPYSKSVIAWFPVILTSLKGKGMSPQKLMETLVIEQCSMGDFLDAIDCLYFLKRIELTEEGRILQYVEADPL